MPLNQASVIQIAALLPVIAGQSPNTTANDGIHPLCSYIEMNDRIFASSLSGFRIMCKGSKPMVVSHSQLST